MPSSQSPRVHDEAFWRDFLSNPDMMRRRGRRAFARLPHGPRCRLCAAPFAGAGGQLMRLVGIRQADANPTVCNSCEKTMIRHHGGAEVEGALMFADIRGSTALAERMTPAAFHVLLDRFYSVATAVVVDNEGMIDKFVGDEVVATFPPMMSGGRHAAAAVAAARALLTATGHGTADGPWVPVGAGVHVGRVWFGVVGEPPHVELTVVGDPVNTTARLAAAAGPGEILVSADAAASAGLDPSLERRALDLKGKSQPTEVVPLRIGPA